MKQKLLFLFLLLAVTSFSYSQIANQPNTLEVCDDFVNDGFTVFDLTQNDSLILGSQDPNDFVISYYETLSNAENDVNPLFNVTSYANILSNSQTMYARITEISTGNFDTTFFTIRVFPVPSLGEPDDLVLCDEFNSGDMTEVFDLTQNDAIIINGEAGVSLSYHISQSNALDGVNMITDPSSFVNTSSPQTIYVRVENDITGCFVITDFLISVNPLPEVVAVTDFVVCELNSDGAAVFDLTTKDAEVLNGQDSSIFEVAYHVSQADANNLNSALVSPYINVVNPQPIYVAITNTITGCSISTQVFNVKVQEAAQANADMNLINYVICDNIGDNDGFGQFDLTTQNPEVLDDQDPANYIVTYYFTEADAELGVNPLPFTYENVTNPQVIYARVGNDTPNGADADNSICYAVTPLTLQVDLLPIFDLEDTYTLCVDTNGTEVINPSVLDTGLSTADYTFEWSLDATVLPSETGSSLTATVSGIYTVLVTNTTTGCQNMDSAEVEMLDCTDSDNDGIIDSDEDINGNGNLDDDDTDEDGIPNYLDSDDDGDNVDTSIEINIVSGRSANAFHPFVDTDGDLIENYLDNDDDGDGVLTIDEDYNNNGDPTDDDTDMSGVPDYLEMNVALTITEQSIESFSIYPNPTNDVVNIQMNGNFVGTYNVDVFDIQGKQILSKATINETSMQLDVSNLESGLYFIKIKNETTEMIKKLIIN